MPKDGKKELDTAFRELELARPQAMAERRQSSAGGCAPTNS
jgi:hypothetical protein